MSHVIKIPRYQCHKQVQALKIKLVIENPRGFELHFEDERYCPIQMTAEWVAKRLPSDKGYSHLIGGYAVWYEDGYASWSPAEAFESGYAPVDADQCDRMGNPSQAALDVLAERRRQVEAEGWTPKHDDEYANGELSDAAGCYALHANDDTSKMDGAPAWWPWGPEWWKPAAAPRRNLVKAAALLLAEIERLDRQADQANG